MSVLEKVPDERSLEKDESEGSKALIRSTSKKYLKVF